VQAFVRASEGGAPGETFDDLALAIAGFQAEHVPAFGRLVRARGVDLAKASTASAIPAVPTDVFKLARVAAHPPEEDVAVFRTSGTTVGDRGEHALRTTETYELVALTWAARCLWPDRLDLDAIILAPEARVVPDSSLGFMLDRFARALRGRASWHLTLRGAEAILDLEGIARGTAEARGTGRPAVVLATSFALVHLLDQRGAIDLRLPSGSRVMQTGGFKGRSREVDAETLRALLAEAFDVAPSSIVSEYGMTELSSQLYDGALATSLGRGQGLTARLGSHAAPPWLRVIPVDPISLEPVPSGQVGIARIVDLANVDSAVAIQTADRARIAEDGGVELLGRLPGAPPRGCSIAVDEMLGGS